MSKISDILVIYSKKSELVRAEFFLRNFFRKCGISEKYFDKVYLCTSEAVMNAIHHGNKRDEEKKITITAWHQDGVVSLEIRDEGDGFDVSNVKNPTCDENIKRESGRGIFIIENLSEGIKFKDKGNCICFKVDCT